MKRKTVNDHKQKSCPEMIVKCDLNCGAEMKRKAVSDHQHTRCPKMIVEGGINWVEVETNEGPAISANEYDAKSEEEEEKMSITISTRIMETVNLKKPEFRLIEAGKT